MKSSEWAGPDLVWTNGVPRSAEYDDVYYSAEDGLEETRHVFLRGNALSERLCAHAAPWFRVGETGFGTGLNLLALWQMWDGLPEPKPNLHFVTLDRHPLPPAEMGRAHVAWPELTAHSEDLCAAMPPPYPGVHRRLLAGGRIMIDFLWGEAAAMLGGYAWAEGEARLDAWFLDGFSPAKNPEMWRAELYEAMARLSGPGTSVATFTSAGHVRRGLIAAGFAMRRAPGYGRKHEMLVGMMPEAIQTIRAPVLPARTLPAIVLGAGIAGIGAAYRLAQQGREVWLLEAADHICAGASGNPAAACLPYFTADWSRRGRLYASGFAHMQYIWDGLEARGHRIGQRCGALALALDETTRERQLKRLALLDLPPSVARALDRAEAEEIAGVTLPSGGLFHPQAGWIDMRALCTALLAEAGDRVQLHTRQRAESLYRENNIWHLRMQNGETLRSDLIVLAAGAQARELLPSLGLEPVRGQLLRFAPPPSLMHLQTLLNFKQTLMPAMQGRMLLGSTYAHNDADVAPRTEDTIRLTNGLRHIFPDIGPIEAEPWVGLRAAHAHRQPLVGPVMGMPGLYLHLAHGSRGTLSGLQPLASDAF